MISVLIGTYGDSRWRDLAYSRAVPSALDQTDDIVPIHGPSLAAARNEAASYAKHDWLCFLDADDELSPGYLDAMRYAIGRYAPDTENVLFTPRTQYVGRRGSRRPTFPRRVPIEDGNWLVIGTVVARDAFENAGGFEEFPIYEDWALFARIQKAGGTVVEVPGAIYRAHRAVGRSRNHPLSGRPDREFKLRAHDEIRRAVFPELYEPREVPPPPPKPRIVHDPGRYS